VLPSADRLVVLKTILHACDISNPTRTWRASKRWSDRLLREFFAQGDLEKRLGLPVSANMDRDETDQDKMSLNFIDFIVAPLFVATAAILPGVTEACDSMTANRRQWEQRLEASQAKAESKAGGRAGKGAAERGAAGSASGRAAWKRRSTAFHQVLMPMVHRMVVREEGDDGSGAGSMADDGDSTGRVMALNALSTFAAAASGELAPVGEDAEDAEGKTVGGASDPHGDGSDLDLDLDLDGSSDMASDDEEVLGWGSKPASVEGSVAEES